MVEGWDCWNQTGLIHSLRETPVARLTPAPESIMNSR